MIESVRAANRFMRLPEDHRSLVIEAMFYLICARIATFTTSTRTLLALGKVENEAATPRLQDDSLPSEILPAIRALDQGSRTLTFANCLTRALALRMLLAHRDIATEIHIGARKDATGAFAAHAWLTYNETILVGGEEPLDLYRELRGISTT